MNDGSFQIDHLEKIISLAQKIKDARRNLDLLIEAWNFNYPGVAIAAPPVGVEAKPTSQSPLAATQMGSIDDKIVHHLDQHPDRQYNANMLHEQLAIPPSSLGTQLSKLYRQGRIVRLGRGFYRSTQASNSFGFTEVNKKEATEVTS